LVALQEITGPSKKKVIGQNGKDWDKSLTSDREMFSCMHLTMLMRKNSFFS
jgi:hypothetical protein